MKHFNQKRGLPAGRQSFTLIELLVVIAIIGLLASIVMINLNSARNKAKDAAIKGALSEGRAAAEMYYDGIGNGAYTNLCNDTDIGRISASITASGGTLECQRDADEYCLEANLKSFSPTQYWCVDHTGVSKNVGTSSHCNGSNGDIDCY